MDNQLNKNIMAPSTVTPAELGARVKSIRESKQFSIPELARVTRIGRDFIVNLEEGNFDKLPGYVFARGFIRSICRALDVNSDDIVIDFDKLYCQELKVEEKKNGLDVHTHTQDEQENVSNVMDALIAKNKFVQNYLSQLFTKYRKLFIQAPIYFALAGLVVFFAFKLRQANNQIPTQSTAGSSTESIEPMKVAEIESANGKTVELNDQENINKTTDSLSQTKAESISVPINNNILKIKALADAKIKIKIDRNLTQSVDLAVGDHAFDFNEKIELRVFDLPNLEIEFGGQTLKYDPTHAQKFKRFVFFPASKQKDVAKKN